ncbi:hypothetical protein VNO77_18944 [Canavalia gladiata]|uniref:Uncharacterized protein n=1 Tax=Canavalia gladiata TaxID=3824 RepID=A0AAN9LQF9_CANGL
MHCKKGKMLPNSSKRLRTYFTGLGNGACIHAGKSTNLKIEIILKDLGIPVEEQDTQLEDAHAHALVHSNLGN